MNIINLTDFSTNDEWATPGSRSQMKYDSFSLILGIILFILYVGVNNFKQNKTKLSPKHYINKWMLHKSSVCRNRHLTVRLPLFFTNLVSRNILSVTNNIQSHVLRELNMIDWIVSKADRWLQSESYSCFIFKWCLKVSVIS